ncbi:sodium:solute symporter [Siminovitchia sediminis]|uniref:Sodium:solute symporter n=1 Tax=Siminovitchia sediminis TaxID=1274353 RepID=A0ABW4KF64_9BACI
MNVVISIAVMIGFLLLNLIVISIFRKKQDSIEEYAVGNRSFPWFYSMFGFLGAWYIGSIYTGFFSDSATIGLFAQYFAVYAIGTMVTMYIMARPVWILGKVYKLETHADMAELRYKSKVFATFITYSSFVFWAPWLIVELKTIGYLVTSATYGVVPSIIGIIVVGGFVIFYSWWGGMRAGVVGDLVQGLSFTVLGTATVVYLLYVVYGGIGPMFQMVATEKPSMLTIGDSMELWIWSSAIITGSLGGMMNPGMFNRLYMAESVRALKKGVLFGPIIGIIFTFLLLWLGLGVTFLDGFPEDLQNSVFWMADKYGGPVVLGLMGVFALAACMSTLSAAATTASVLIGKNMLSSKLSEEKRLKLTRFLTLLLGIVAMYIATMDISRIVEVIIHIYEFMAQLAVPFLLGFYWKRGNIYGAFTGMIAGSVIVLLGVFTPELISMGGVSSGIIGLVFNLTLYIIVSLLTSKQQHVDELFEAVENYTPDGHSQSEFAVDKIAADHS